MSDNDEEDIEESEEIIEEEQSILDIMPEKDEYVPPQYQLYRIYVKYMNEALSHRDKTVYHTRSTSLDRALQTLVSYPWEQWAICSIIHTETYKADLKVDQLPDIDDSIFTKYSGRTITPDPSSAIKTVVLKTKASKTRSKKSASTSESDEQVD
jgi:hypothetical protein